LSLSQRQISLSKELEPNTFYNLEARLLFSKEEVSFATFQFVTLPRPLFEDLQIRPTKGIALETDFTFTTTARQI
jgi:hypothetical protein